jgi:hypothetical protein
MTYTRKGSLFVPTRNIIVPRGDVRLPHDRAEYGPAMIGAVAGSRRRTVAAASATDDFNRSNDPISSPGSDGVITWVSGPGDLAAIKVLSNVCYRSGAGASGGMVSIPNFAANQIATITFAGTPTATGVMCRMQGSISGSGYLLYVSGTVTLQYYHRTEGGTLRQIGSNKTITAVAAGDTISLKVTGTATITLEAFRNGVSVDSRTDNTDPYNSGQPGVYFGGANGTDQFTASDV